MYIRAGATLVVSGASLRHLPCMVPAPRSFPRTDSLFVPSTPSRLRLPLRLLFVTHASARPTAQLSLQYATPRKRRRSPLQLSGLSLQHRPPATPACRQYPPLCISLHLIAFRPES
ncbi:hypothetical protein M407DRAFT_204360 [Tulasnella calospora MUT 4182]|uniref:Uncharacterized protein n=1 Tax=Tulasnella calospora MUT 4182 TaxID=1051891 RepID=A0A0C3QW53_9AGAM|nr:hypothetical protein M407DRAFT_204360 [Tulasnella calospora MUT 4182]